MADLILKVTPEEVNTKAGQIESQKQLMETYMADMQSKVNDLQSAWDSPSGKAYYAKYTSLSQSIKASLNELATHVTNLKDAAAKYEQVNTETNTLVENLSDLSTSGIFK